MTGRSLVVDERPDDKGPARPDDAAAVAAVEDRSRWATGRLLSTAARLNEQGWNTLLRASDVTHAGLIVLHMLSHGPASQRELAGSQYLTEQTIGRTLGHLEATGHIVRATDPADRRRRVVEITGSGQALLAELSGTEETMTNRVLADAGIDAKSFRAGLQALIDASDEPVPPERGQA